MLELCPEPEKFKEPKNRLKGIDSARLGIDSWPPYKVYKFGLRTGSSRARIESQELLTTTLNLIRKVPETFRFFLNFSCKAALGYKKYPPLPKFE
jgi:hypothetical protein